MMQNFNQTHLKPQADHINLFEILQQNVQKDSCLMWAYSRTYVLINFRKHALKFSQTHLNLLST